MRTLFVNDASEPCTTSMFERVHRECLLFSVNSQSSTTITSRRSFLRRAKNVACDILDLLSEVLPCIITTVALLLKIPGNREYLFWPCLDYIVVDTTCYFELTSRDDKNVNAVIKKIHQHELTVFPKQSDEKACQLFHIIVVGTRRLGQNDVLLLLVYSAFAGDNGRFSNGCCLDSIKPFDGFSCR